MNRRVNGAHVVSWEAPPPLVAYDAAAATGPRCPKRCDTATPPEHGGGDQYVCICCGTQFTWKAKPS